MKFIIGLVLVIVLVIFVWEKWVSKWLKKIRDKHNF